MNVKLYGDTLLPKFGREGDAGYDFFLNEDVVIKPRKQVCINTGVAVEIPLHHAGLFALRSSICNKYKHLHLKNPLVDSNFRGEIHIIIYNDSFIKTAKFKKGDRIASLFVYPIYDRPLKAVYKLSGSNRNGKWNGSSGK